MIFHVGYSCSAYYSGGIDQGAIVAQMRDGTIYLEICDKVARFSVSM